MNLHKYQLIFVIFIILGSGLYDSRQARVKWNCLQRTIGRAARSRQAVLELERELERLLEERESLSRDLASVNNHFTYFLLFITYISYVLQIKRRQKIHETTELANEEDTLLANLNYIQENMQHVQQSIMELEEGKESAGEKLQLQNLIENIKSVDEAKYYLEKLCGTSISQVCDAALSQTRLKERDALLNEVQQDSHIQQELLQHVIARNTNDLTTTEQNLNTVITNNLNEMRTLYNNNKNGLVYSDLSELGNNNSINSITTTNSLCSSRSPSPNNSLDQ